MRASTWAFAGLLLTVLSIFAIFSLLPTASYHLGVPVNQDITVRTDVSKPKKKSPPKEERKRDASESKTKTSKDPTIQMDGLYSRIADLEKSLEIVDQSASSLKELLASYSSKSKSQVSSPKVYTSCLAIDELKIEEISPYLRSPLWYKGGDLDPRYVEDRSHFDFLANHYNTDSASRRIYLDLGAGSFQSSVGWFNKNYPVHFDEIHAFECVPKVFQTPPRDEIGAKLYDSIHAYELCVNTFDDVAQRALDFPKWMKDVLRPSKSDFVVLKIDVEGSEWSLLAALENAGLHHFVDELFVEIHYHEPLLIAWGWGGFTQTREEATALLRHWRSLGVYAHYWP